MKQQQVPEHLGASQRTGDGSRHAQLDEQRNQDQLGFDLPHRSTLRPHVPVAVASCVRGVHLYRVMHYSRIEKVAEAALPTRWGDFRILGFEGHLAPDAVPGPQGKLIDEVAALVYGDPGDTPPIVRVHSQCLTGDVFHSLRCDCRQQLELALDTITTHGAGIIVYEAQEGRGIGLMAKLRAYELQDQGRDTVEANVELGYRVDHRDFSLPAEVIKQLGYDRIRLITNNPEKVQAMESHGVQVVERISAEVAAELTSEKYLEVKRDKMGHLIGSLTSR